MSRLPPELLIHVIDALRDCSSFPDQIRRRTLRSLCLTSHFLRELAIPLLYSSIRITLPGRFEELSRSPYVPEHLTSISVADHNTWGPRFLGYIPLVCSVLEHARHKLHTVILDLPLRAVMPEDDVENVKQQLRHTLESLPALTTLVSCRDELFLRTERELQGFGMIPGNWMTMTQLRRLSLYNPDVDQEFTDACLSLPHLEAVVVHNADMPGADAGPLTALVTANNPAGLPLTVTYICDYPEVLARDDLSYVHELAKRHPNFRVIGTPKEVLDHERNTTQDWIRGLAETGMLSQLQTEPRIDAA
ncbi:hypothetical protein PUNSTDRAFT_146859 [Punctularia strigosozonata HHB-11173 SS5]|uniref:F-box domain-containing protein n=1 Tax=Punctularia strigosozonata (strain HHB-11173) TaxID=741275 RepID=R7S205_PUNST|nr:uncharacterized protein PUNSTDRAFT_146859 [Punctularia strigosozonata HHB-11173 SS5]EIN03899.1 hypothetical protein PUNSTDRAFT_146859 [Punctularia strigosozonata HHB-11173 SS5]